MAAAPENVEKDPEFATPPVPPAWGGLRLIHLVMMVAAFAVVFAAVVVFGEFLARTGAFPFIVLGVVVLMVFAFVSVVILAKRRSTHQEALLWVLAIAAEQNMPLATAIVAFAGQCGSIYRQKLLGVANLLNSGMSLPRALETVPGVLPSDAQVYIRVGDESNALAGALREAATARSSKQPVWGVLASRFTYLFVVLVFLQLIFAFIAYFITPKYEAIFMDFGIKLPEATIMTIQLSHFLIGPLGLLYALFVLAQVLFLMCLPFLFAGWGSWNIPLIDRLFRSRHASLILRALARLVEAGKPLTAGFATLARCYPVTWVRGRLVSVRQDVERGGDWYDSLRDRGLIRRTDAAVLEAAQRVGNLPWALRETAERGDRRLTYRLQALVQMLFPVVVLSMGALVFFVAVAYFSPLITLIEVLGR